jgi:hypothetical protein
MIAPYPNRPGCKHPNACRAKGPRHCPECSGAIVGKRFGRINGVDGLDKARANANKRQAERVRAKRVPITLAPGWTGKSPPKIDWKE